jgi:hypothetical protein
VPGVDLQFVGKSWIMRSNRSRKTPEQEGVTGSLSSGGNIQRRQTASANHTMINKDTPSGLGPGRD